MFAHSNSQISPNHYTRRTSTDNNETGYLFNLAKLIGCNKYDEAYQQCTTNNLLHLLSIVKICYEHHLMSYIIYSPDKILRIKHELHLLTEQGLDRLKKLIDFREYSVKAKENYQEINQNIKALVAQGYLSSNISGLNPELKQIKNSLHQAYKQIKRLKQKSSPFHPPNLLMKQQPIDNQLKDILLKLSKKVCPIQKVEELKKKDIIQLVRQTSSCLDETIKGFQSEIQVLKGKLQTENETNNTLRKSIQLLQEEFEESKKNQMDYINKVEDLQCKIGMMELQNVQLHRKSNRMNSIEQQKHMLEEEADLNNKLSQELKEQNELLQLQRVRLQEKIQKMEQDKKRRQEKIKQDQLKNRQKISDLEQNIEKMKIQIAAKNEQVCNLNLRVLEQNQSVPNPIVHEQSQNKITSSKVFSYDTFEHEFQLKTKIKFRPFEKAKAKDTKIVNLKLDLQMCELQLKKQKKELQRIKQERNQLEQFVEELKNQILDLQNTNKNNEEQIAQLMNESIKQKEEYEKLQEKYNTLEDEIQLINAQKDYYRNKVEAIEQEQQFKRMNSGGYNTILTLEDLDAIQVTIKEQQQQIGTLMQEQETILSSNRELEEKYNYIIEDTNFAKIQKRHSFFIGNVLDGMEDDRVYLVSMLQKNTRNHIRKTALIYQYDPLNKVNFHKYIDNHTHIVVLIKLKNGWTCGGYSEGGFIPKHQSDKDGLIFSLTMRKFFELKVRNKKAITYDEFYIIFGNSELRIKSQENKLFSNFGLTSSFYDSKGQKVDVITGEEGAREVELEYLQIYKLLFY